MKMKKNITIVALFVITLLASNLSAFAYPGALNVVPTADVLGSQNIRIGYETDGNKHPFYTGNIQYLYTQAGIGNRAEAGVDLYGLFDTNTPTVNAKYLILPGGTNTPAVAAGIYGVNKLSKPSYYLISTTAFGKFRATVGGQKQGGDTWALLGADYAVTPEVTLLADAQTGTGRQATLGVYYVATPELGLNVYYARNNTSRSSDYYGLYVGYTFSTK